MLLGYRIMNLLLEAIREVRMEYQLNTFYYFVLHIVTYT